MSFFESFDKLEGKISLAKRKLQPFTEAKEYASTRLRGHCIDDDMKEKEINHVLSNSFGFGGNCSTLIFSKS